MKKSRLLLSEILVSLLILLSSASNAQFAIINTIVGGHGDSIPAVSSALDGNTGIATDRHGNIYIVEEGDYRIRKVNSVTGIITTVAGNGIPGFSGDGGPATSASFWNNLQGIAVDTAGNIYIVDRENQRIRKITAATGIINTIAGTGGQGYNGDGIPAISATLSNPYNIAVDDSENVYISDNGNNRIRKVTASTGLISTIANATNPASIALDQHKNVFFSDGEVIRELTASTGTVSLIAGNGSGSYTGDGNATSVGLADPSNISIDTSGNIYILTNTDNRLRKFTKSAGVISTIAGTGSQGFNGDGGPASVAELNNPNGLTIDSSGNIYISDDQRIRKIEVTTGIINTIAGNGMGPYGAGFYGDGGLVNQAQLRYPNAVAFDKVGNLYISDEANQRIRMVNAATNIITTIAGNGTSGYNGDGKSALSSELYDASGLSIDSTGNVYIADALNNRIRKITASSGILTSIAGDSLSGFNSDGIIAIKAQLANPSSVALDNSGNVLIADEGNNRIRKVDRLTGIISTIAGTGTKGFGGDKGFATAAQLNNPTGIAVDHAGNMYIADGGNNRIRKINASDGKINTIAGNGSANYNGDTIAAMNAGLGNVANIALDVFGNLYITGAGSWIQKVNISTGILTTIAGNGSNGFSGDGGPAINAVFRGPLNITLDSAGNIFVADQGNSRIRKISILNINNQPASSAICVNSDTSFTVKALGSGISYQWQVNSGTGFTNISNDTIYSGSGLATIKISKAPLSFSGNKYRCILTSTALGTINSDTIKLTVDNPKINIVSSPSSAIICNGNPLTLTANGGISYQWNHSVQNGFSFTPSSSGEYTVTETDSLGCKKTDSIHLIVNPNPVLVIGGNPKLCNGADLLTANASGNSPLSYNWNTSGQQDTIVVHNAASYSVTVTDINTCKSSASIQVLNDTVPTVNICMVTVDSLSQHNIIIWDKTSATNVDSFIVYREITANNYARIGAQTYGTLSQFIDTVSAKYFPYTGNPNSGTYRYKLQVRDSCGNYSVLSPYHNTIFVNKTGGTFNWNQYEIEGQSVPVPTLSSYLLYRDDNSTGNWQLVTGVASTQTTMTDANYTTYPNGNWRVETSWGITCTPTLRTTASFSSSFSNASKPYVTGIENQNQLNNTLKTYPNPFSAQTTVELKLFNISSVQLRVYNSLGQEISTLENKQLDAGNYKYELTIPNNGIYFLRSIVDGIPSTQKLIKVGAN